MNPGNLFLCEDGRVKLGGLEQHVGVQALQSKKSREVYDALGISKEGDARSLGVSLMEVLEGEDYLAVLGRKDVHTLMHGNCRFCHLYWDWPRELFNFVKDMIQKDVNAMMAVRAKPKSDA